MSIVIASTPASSAASASQAATGDAARAAATKTGTSSGSAPVAAAKPADVPSATVTLSEQALNLLNHPDASVPHAAAAASGSTSIYESLKKGITTAAEDVGDAASDSAHWLANGVESAVSAADTLAHGVADLPFAVVGKICDATGAMLDAL